VATLLLNKFPAGIGCRLRIAHFQDIQWVATQIKKTSLSPSWNPKPLLWIACPVVVVVVVVLLLLLLLLLWRYSPGWALASITISLQASRSLALSLHSFIPIFLRSVDHHPAISFLVFLCVLLHTAFHTASFGDCCVLHSFYVTKPSYSLAFNKPDNVLPLKLVLFITTKFNLR
jgi:hypothetical protein